MQYNITKQQLAALERFKKELSEYHELANSVWAARSGRDYVSDSELEDRKRKEKKLRDKLNTDYGKLEDLIINLYGGSKPAMIVPNVPGVQWDIFAESLGGNFSVTKGQCLVMAEQVIAQLVGKAKSLVGKDKVEEETKIGQWFPDGLLKRISNKKVKILCSELDKVFPENPNSAALLMRTILLVVLQQKLGNKAKDDLGPVLNQAISQDIYKDRQIKKILTNFSGMPKTLLDATHHSRWMLITSDEMKHWLPGLVRLVEATYKDDN